MSAGAAAAAVFLLLLLLSWCCCCCQVETYLSKLSSDKAYKQEYVKLWSEQRRCGVTQCVWVVVYMLGRRFEWAS